MVKRLKEYYKNKKKIVDKFYESKKFLYPGKYSFDESLTYIHLDDQNVMRKSVDLFSQGLPVVNFFKDRFFTKTVVTKILRFYFNKKLVISEKAIDGYRGTVYLPGGNGKEVKIFDFENKEVLIFYNSKHALKGKLRTYNQFSHYFPIPPIIDADEKQRIIIERYIDYKSNMHWSEYDFNFVANEIFRRYLEYFKEAIKSGEMNWMAPAGILKSLPEKDEFIEEILAGISPELLEKPFAVLPIHGDLWSSNILIDKEDPQNIFFIDWELAGEMFFFYDFFAFMWNEALTNKNFSFIRSYANGEYDDYYYHAFELFGLKFDAARRQEYLNIFFLNMYLKRWMETAPDYLEFLHLEYRNLMNYVTSLTVLPEMPRRS
ncbi:phosphotransferase [Planococcus sp. CAU13]|uniref:phosphotransferase n=1 Tax=Planococcus sp. CAU13 TaxID=1541197 RepID=UPI00052FFDB7|nr:phosphotransferase [Planococcus sp. CAU13]